MIKILAALVFLLIVNQSAQATDAVPNPRYANPGSGYAVSETNPVLVAGLGEGPGPVKERRYLERLRGPSGEPVTYERLGSCCPFETPNPTINLHGIGLLDQYAISYPGLHEPLKIYLNMYDPGDVRAPSGFTLSE